LAGANAVFRIPGLIITGLKYAADALSAEELSGDAAAGGRCGGKITSGLDSLEKGSRGTTGVGATIETAADWARPCGAGVIGIKACCGGWLTEAVVPYSGELGRLKATMSSERPPPTPPPVAVVSIEAGPLAAAVVAASF
jgi:hypothetical protein